MSTKKVWIFDIEQFQNFHSCTFMNRDDITEIKQFVICESRNDFVDYYLFLKNECAGLIGFNNVNFDYPLIHFFISFMEGYPAGRELLPDTLNKFLYEETQRIVKAEYSSIPEYETRIPQLDLFRIHHFDNKNKRTSLKAIEIAINFENVQDLPFEPDHIVETDEIDQILEYNLNDVKATREFYLLTMDAIDMRKKLGSKYKLNLRNANDPKIGQEIFGHEIAKRKDWRYKYLKELRTYRHYIRFNECILPYIEFRSNEFKTLLEELKSMEITTTYDAFNKSVIFKGFKYDYGTGGIHGCIEPGVYKAEGDIIIMDIDVKSYYPNLAIENKFFPQHLGEDFVEVYRDLFLQRLQAQKEKDQATNSGLKLALNGTFGKSNDKFSLFYDPKYFIQITINGQLLLTMLAEEIALDIPTAEFLQVNTDGITVRIPETEKEMLEMICKSWEQKTRLILEFKQYSMMVIRDVNNYMAVDTTGKPKYKGCFEITPQQNGAVAYNKDWSMRVVPKALDAYYRYGTPIEDFIRNHDNIFDFCLGFRAREGWELYRTYIECGYKIKEKLQRTIRYYVSNNGDSITKENDDSIIQLEAGYACTLFNRYIKREMSEYNINYSYYISQANKIKNAVYDGQLKLF